jgi:O-antigen/teichoic acid export membrane protein
MSWGVDGLMLSAVFAVFGAALLQTVLIPFPMRFRASLGGLRQLTAFALPLGLNGAFGVTFDRLNRILLAAWCGPVAVALFEAGSRVPDAGIQAYMGFQSAFFPNMSALLGSGQVQRATAALNRTLRLLCFPGSMAILAFYVFRRELVMLLFSPKYSDAAGVLGILLGGLVVAVANNLLHTTLIASGSTRAALKAGIFQGVVTTILYIALIPRLGYVGSAYAYVAGNILVNPVVLWMLKGRGINIEPGSYLKPMALLAVSLGAATLFHSALVALCAILVPFVAGGILMKCVTMDDFRLLWRAIPRPRLLSHESAKLNDCDRAESCELL